MLNGLQCLNLSLKLIEIESTAASICTFLTYKLCYFFIALVCFCVLCIGIFYYCLEMNLSDSSDVASIFYFFLRIPTDYNCVNICQHISYHINLVTKNINEQLTEGKLSKIHPSLCAIYNVANDCFCAHLQKKKEKSLKSHLFAQLHVNNFCLLFTT